MTENTKPLPVISVKDTLFEVDVKQNHIRQKDKPENTIAFNDMEYTDTHYSFKYDPTLKSAELENHTKDNLIDVQIPHKVILDPVRMAEKYKVSVQELRGKTDFDIIVNQELFLQRSKKGMLPTIDIAGQSFFIDLRLNELRATDNFMNKIDLRLPFEDYEGRFHFFYDTQKNEMAKTVNLDAPDHLVYVVIPSRYTLDPYSLARDHYLDVKDVLVKHPIQPDLKAQIWRPEKAMAKVKKLDNNDALLSKKRSGENKGNKNSL